MIPGSDILCTEELETSCTEGQVIVVNPLVAT